MPTITRDASELTRRKNARTIYTNIITQKEDLTRGSINRVIYQGGNHNGIFVLNQIRVAHLYNSSINEANSQEEAQRILEAERIAEEAERIAQETQRIAQEAERIAQEAERIAQEEAERIAQEEAERIAQEAQRIAQEAERIAQEAERIAQEEAEAEAQRIAQEEAEAEAERIAQEDERIAQEAERIAQEAERIAQEAERIAQGEAERIAQEAERITQESQRIAEEVKETQIKVLVLGDLTIGSISIKIKSDLQGEGFTKVKVDACILGTTYNGSHLENYNRVYYYPSLSHTGSPDLEMNLKQYTNNGGDLRI